MALTTCPECTHEVSTDATRCPSCGAKLKMGWFGKMVIGVVAIFVGMVIFGAMIPEETARANEARRMCEKELMPKGMATQYDCDKLHHDIKSGKKP